ncbi:MAG: TetR family transcriptional regulator [Acidimicrobiales bacterium]
MSRRRVTLHIEPVLQGLATIHAEADPALAILRAARALMYEFGLRRWTMEDVADRAEVGRTSVYRAFSTREQLMHAVLAQELRDTIDVIERAASGEQSVEEKLVGGAVAALGALSHSIVDRLVQTDPATFLPFLTTHAGPLVAIAREAIATQVQALDPSIDRRLAGEVGEAAARLGLSFVLVRETVLPVDDPAALVASVRRILGPLLAGAR